MNSILYICLNFLCLLCLDVLLIHFPYICAWPTILQVNLLVVINLRSILRLPWMSILQRQNGQLLQFTLASINCFLLLYAYVLELRYFLLFFFLVHFIDIHQHQRGMQVVDFCFLYLQFTSCYPYQSFIGFCQEDLVSYQTNFMIFMHEVFLIVGS